MTSSSVGPRYDERSYPPAYFDCPGAGAMLVQNVYRKSVVFIGVLRNGRFKPLGTGFIVSLVRSGYRFKYIVTARHLIAGSTVNADLRLVSKVAIRLNAEGGGTECVEFEFGHWKEHPKEHIEATDVMVLPAPWLDRSKHIFAHIPIEENALTENKSEDLGVGVGDEIFSVGLFTKHEGKTKNVPVLRIGNIALMPEEPVKTKLGYVTAYLVEARSIAGLSGSPVFVHFHPFRKSKGKVMPLDVEGGLLLGLMHGHFDAQDIDGVTEDRDDGKSLGIHTGMGVVIPVQRIMELLNSLEGDRQNALKELNKGSSVQMDGAGD